MTTSHVRSFAVTGTDHAEAMVASRVLSVSTRAARGLVGALLRTRADADCDGRTFSSFFRYHCRTSCRSPSHFDLSFDFPLARRGSESADRGTDTHVPTNTHTNTPTPAAVVIVKVRRRVASLYPRRISVDTLCSLGLALLSLHVIFPRGWRLSVDARVFV